MNRRTLLAFAFLAGCARKLAPRYFGRLFIASAAQRGIAVADLSEFRRITTIPLAQIPAQVLRVGTRIFATCPDAHSLSVIDPAALRVVGKVDVAGHVAFAAVMSGSGQLAVLTQKPDLFLLIDPATGRISRKVPLPQPPSAMDLTESTAAITVPGAVIRLSLATHRIAGITATGGDCAAIRFLGNGEVIFAGLPSTREIVSIDAATGSVLARLPMAFRPARFCFNADGGQMFVTGTEGDNIAIVDAYQNQVDQTMVGGSAPYGIATANIAGRDLLFVTNSGSGYLTVFDIETRRLASSVHVGGNPGEVLITPGGEYALVIGLDTGDVAVVRVSTILDKSMLEKDTRTKPLFTVFATGASPQSAAIVPAAEV